MKQVIFVGLDVDDNSFHGCAFLKESGEIIEFKTRPHIDGLSKKLREIAKKFPNCELRCCYEATTIGFSLARDLAKTGRTQRDSVTSHPGLRFSRNARTPS